MKINHAYFFCSSACRSIPFPFRFCFSRIPLWRSKRIIQVEALSAIDSSNSDPSEYHNPELNLQLEPQTQHLAGRIVPFKSKPLSINSATASQRIFLTSPMLPMWVPAKTRRLFQKSQRFWHIVFSVSDSQTSNAVFLLYTTLEVSPIFTQQSTKEGSTLSPFPEVHI